jgi:hypothetical protein
MLERDVLCSEDCAAQREFYEYFSACCAEVGLRYQYLLQWSLDFRTANSWFRISFAHLVSDMHDFFVWQSSL